MTESSELPYFDISPEISENIGVFPGDVQYSRHISCDFKKGDGLLLSSIQSTLHLGAHVDGPNHYSQSGVDIGARRLSFYMGRCLVLHANVSLGERVGLQNFDSQWQTTTSWPAPRILVRTKSFPDPNNWNHDFCSFDPKLIEIWAKAGVCLVGIDTPSIDSQDSKSLPAHKMVAHYDLAILEGVVLEKVPEGLYTLIALPLRLAGADASPVRAILFRDAELLGS